MFVIRPLLAVHIPLLRGYAQHYATAFAGRDLVVDYAKRRFGLVLSSLTKAHMRNERTHFADRAEEFYNEQFGPMSESGSNPSAFAAEQSVEANVLCVASGSSFTLSTLAQSEADNVLI